VNVCKVEKCVVVTFNDKDEQLNLMFDTLVLACSLNIHFVSFLSNFNELKIGLPNSRSTNVS
jgi:hypothetical protein